MKVQTVEGCEEPEVLFIGRVDNWVNVPRSNRDPTVARQKVGFQHRGKDWDHVEPPPGLLTNRFKVLEVDEDDEEQVDGQEVCNIRTVAAKSDEKNKKKCQTDDEWLNLGIGELVVDSAADESCWPIGVGDAFPTKQSKRNILLKTAYGGEMVHYGEKCVTFTHDGDGGKEVVGLKFQVTDVRKPLLAVRRRVEHGSVVSLEQGTRTATSSIRPRSHPHDLEGWLVRDQGQVHEIGFVGFGSAGVTCRLRNRTVRP